MKKKRRITTLSPKGKNQLGRSHTWFLDVGVEALAGATIINYGKFIGVPLSQASFFTGLTMGSMVAGYIIGIIIIPKFISQETALKICASLGILFTFGIVFTTGMTS